MCGVRVRRRAARRRRAPEEDAEQDRVQRRRGAECRLDARVCGWIVCASALPTLCERGLAPGTAQAIAKVSKVAGRVRLRAYD